MMPLISTTELAELLAQPGQRPAVLDVRWRMSGPSGAESYQQGHVPGAVHLDLDGELADTPGAGGRHPLPEPGALQRTLRAAGVRADRLVVAYDDADGSVAARAWWLLRWAGHSAVAVLDGGMAAWQAAGNPVSTAAAHPQPGDIEVWPGQMPVLDAAGAARLARDGLLLDARAAQRYTGEHEPVDPRAGHIPGAVSAPFAEHTDPKGRWHTPVALARHFTALGAGESTPVGAYCGSGVTATSVVLALEVAGRLEPAALYAGSFSHWCADPERPVVTGDRPGSASIARDGPEKA